MRSCSRTPASIPCRELKYRNPGRLAEAMAAANAKRKRVDQLPLRKRVGRWIEDARKLTPKITY